MKNATVSARVESDVKDEAEEILKRIGVPVSVVINALYRQIVFQGGIPFSLTLPSSPKAIEDMTPEELDDRLSHSYAQSLAGKVRPYEEVFDELERGLA